MGDLQLGLRSSFDQLSQAIATSTPKLHEAPLPTASQQHANTTGVTWQDPLGNGNLTLPPTDMEFGFFPPMD